MGTNPNFLTPDSNRSSFLKAFPSKGFIEFKMDSTTISPEKGKVVRWHVISSGKRSTLFKFLFLKWLWDELTSQEWKFVLNSPEFFSSKEFLACARALANGIPKKDIRTRLIKFQLLTGSKPSSRNRYRSLASLRYRLCEFVHTDTPAKKFSGWVRHQNDQGSLRKSSVFEIEPVGFTEKLEIDLFSIITVGKLSILGKDILLSPDDDSKESRNGNSKLL